VAPATERTHEVVHGDTFWGLAERYLGSGAHWREIRDHNVGREVAPGRVLGAAEDALDVGWRLVIPRPAREPVPPAPSATEGERSAASEPTPTSPASRPEAPDDEAAAGATGVVEVTVQSGDSLWRLADRHTSDGLGRAASDEEVRGYWTDVVETNRARLVNRINPDLIYPGQRMRLPPAAAPPDAADEAGTRPPAGTRAPGETDRERAPTTAPPSGADVREPAADTDDTTLGAGEAARPEGEPMPGPSAPTTVDEDENSPAAPSEPAAERVSAEDHDSGDDERGDTRWVIGLSGLVGTALAVGVTQAIRRGRRRRAHLAPETVGVEEHGNPVHRDLLLAADTDALDALSRSLGSLATSVADAGLACAPRVVQHGPEHLDVLLDTPTSPTVDGWYEQGGGAVWSRDLVEAPPPELAPCAVPPTPLLVTLGEPDDGGQLYLDLEVAAVVSLLGDPDLAAGVARAMVTEVAHSPLADTAQVILVGDLGVASVAQLDHVTVVADWASVLPDVESWAKGSREALALHGWPNPFVGRGHCEFEDALAPLLVVADHPPDADALAVLAEGPAAAAVVVVSKHPLSDSTIVECSPDELVVPHLGLSCRPQTLSRDDLSAVVDILEDAGGWNDAQLAALLEEPPHEYDPDVIPPEEPVPPDLMWAPPPPDDVPASESPDSTGSTPDSASEPEAIEDGPAEGSTEEPSERDLRSIRFPAVPAADVVVRLLGDIAVEGARKPLTGKQTAIVAYLAAHGTVTSDRLEDAIWLTPSTGPPGRRLINSMSECRGALGGQYLPLAAAGRYTVGPGVITDLELFDRHCEAAQGQDMEGAAQALAEAFALVTGKLFAYSRSDREFYAWVDLENWVSTWELKVATVVEDLAAHYLELGSPSAAVDVADHALRVVPTHAGCTEALMRAHATNGDRTAIRRVYESHLSALEQLDLGPIAETTSSLYEQLIRGREQFGD
jgi:DNA-binding SARP family transcriptional activator/LysM repeat protein